MVIRGNTSTGASIAQSVGAALSGNVDDRPSGGDARSAAIASAVNSFLDTASRETETVNTSVDEVREGMAAAADRITQADQQGADQVANSGRTMTV